MWEGFPLFPEQASTIAGEVDMLFYCLIGVSFVFTVLICFLIFYFAIRYRRRSETEQPRPMIGSIGLELFWSITPFMITMVMFVWATSLYFKNASPPAGALEIYVVAKQWMWKLQHPEGQREINTLHVPIGRPIRLIMTSEDVIHSFYVPAFRVKYDVLPGRYTTLWFEPTKTGEYHLFCAEYCGTKHSAMAGRVIVMPPLEFEKWLGGTATGESLAEIGQRLFQRLGCITCHRPDASGRGPVLEGLFNKPVPLASGETVIADEDYLRESILRPSAKMVAGYTVRMPTFQGQIGEEGLVQIIAFIKSLSREVRIEE